MQIRTRGGNCQCIHRNHGGLHTCTLQANSHIPRRAHAAPLPCSDHAALKAASQGHDTARQGRGTGTAWHVWINIGRLSTACGRPAPFRLLPATTQTFTKVVNQNATAFWICLIVLMTTETADYKEYELNLRFKDILSSVVLLRLHCVFFFWLYVGNNTLTL